MKKYLLIIVVILTGPGIIDAQQEAGETELAGGVAMENGTDKKVEFSYGDKGWQMEFDDRFLMSLEWRLQFRVLVDSNPDENTFSVQRARMKVDGYAFRPWLQYYLEFDFPSLSLLNFEFSLIKLAELQLKLGQWKIEYNTERFISSGKQQFADRSVSNYYFTFDRQIGIMLKGDLFQGKIGCTSYSLGMFNGNGRMDLNDNGKFMYFGRLQWNFSRKVMKMSFGDLERVRKPEGFIAFSATRNISAYTRFSTRGGGQLPGYDNPADWNEKFLIRQLGAELMLKYRGFSLTGENHVKSIDDRESGENSLIYGGFVMAGFFLDPLEMVLRYALVSNDTLYAENINEYVIGLNWYFSGHRNKLTTDLSYLENEDFDPVYDHWRFRFQWDVSF